MNEFVLSEGVDRLENIILNIVHLKPEDRLVSPSVDHLTDIKSVLNEIFKDINCTDVLYTTNIDKAFFGIKVNPSMSATDTIAILCTDEPVRLSKYQVELDSKLFDIDLDAAEIVAYLLYEISSMVDSNIAIDNVRAIIDSFLTEQDDVITIRDSVNYSQLITYGIKDTLYKVSSAMFKDDPEELTSNMLIQTAELQDALLSAQEKIMSSSYGVGESVRSPKCVILRWLFTVYKDMSHNSGVVKETLKDAREFTASKLDKMEIDKTILAVDKINTQTMMESARIDKFLEAKALYPVAEISLFKSLKQAGLRSLFDAYYEYAMRIKNVQDEEDAMFILRGINSRLGILEDYLYNTPDLSPAERKRYEDLAMQYRALREQLIKSKIWKKAQYGLYMDYNELDKLDESVVLEFSIKDGLHAFKNESN